MPPKKSTSKSPAKGSRKRSTSRARSKSPGRPSKAAKAESPATPKSAKKGRGRARSKSRSKSPGRKAQPSPSPARQPKKAAETTGRKKKASLSPPAKKASSPQRKKRASTPSKRPASPATEKKQSKGKKSVTPAISELKAEVTSAIAKKVNDLRETFKRKGDSKVTTVTTTETTTTRKKDEKKVEKKGSKQYEFGGPCGAAVFILLLPAAAFLINLACTKKSCSLTALPEIPTTISAYCDCHAVMLFFGWLVVHAVLAALPVGKLKEGLPLPSGKRLKYRCNGFLDLVLSAAAFSGLYYLKYPLTSVLDHWVPLIVTAIEFTCLLSLFVYIRSRYHRGDSLAPGGNTGNVIYDFFVGRELNPRIRNFDLKLFLETHFGLITWMWLNATFVLKAYEETGTFPLTLLVVVGCQLLVVADILWYEENALSMMDIASDGMGFLFTLGTTVWTPFVFSLQARYLLEHPQNWPYWTLVAFTLLHLVGYFIFRGSNWQKHVFLTNPHHPSVLALETIPATAGNRLLVGGWWGLCRHPNYLGDLIMALAWTLPCGFDSPLPYFYVFNLVLMLLHRSARDGRKCQQKFGAAWDRYCQRVKYRVIPYIY